MPPLSVSETVREARGVPTFRPRPRPHPPSFVLTSHGIAACSTSATDPAVPTSAAISRRSSDVWYFTVRTCVASRVFEARVTSSRSGSSAPPRVNSWVNSTHPLLTAPPSLVPRVCAPEGPPPALSVPSHNAARSSTPARCCAARPGLGRPARTLVTVVALRFTAEHAIATRTTCPPPSSCAPSMHTGTSDILAAP